MGAFTICHLHNTYGHRCIKQPSLKSIFLCIHRLIIPAWKHWEQMDKGRTSNNMDGNINGDRDV